MTDDAALPVRHDSLRSAVTWALLVCTYDNIATRAGIRVLADTLLEAIEPVVESIDLNARRYGWEVGNGATIGEVMESSLDNPFNENWRDAL